MATFDYAQLARTAQSLIDRFGEECSVEIKFSEPAPNPAMPPIVTVRSLVTPGVFLRYKPMEVDGTYIQTLDQRVLIAAPAESIPMGASGMIVRGGEKWNLKGVSILKPGPVTMLYSLQVRR